MTNRTSDVIVLGVGSMGAAACYYLAKHGVRTLGIEQFSIPHENGSHGGQSRIIRKAYFEHPDYVPLLERSYQNWRLIEAETGRQVYHPTGLLYAGKPDHLLIAGVERSAELYGIPLHRLTQQEAKQKYPQFRFSKNSRVIFEPDAGFLTPDIAIVTYANRAKELGARMQTQEKTISWKRLGNGFEVQTDRGVYSCGKLVITAGAWASELMPVLKAKLKVTKQILAWSQPKTPESFELGKLPCWFIAEDHAPGGFYGFPSLPAGRFAGPVGLKLAHHYPGFEVDPNHFDRNETEADKRVLIDFLQARMPDGYDGNLETKSCLYTNTPDEHFVIDFLPGYAQDVTVAAGFSGHGFKFASMVGEVLADLVMNGKTTQPIDFLSVKRLLH